MKVDDKISSFFALLKLSIDSQKDLYACANNPDFALFKKLFISFDAREVKIEGAKQLHYFLIIHDIELHAEFKSAGVFTRMIDFLDEQGINIWVDDIVNNRLFEFLHSKGYKASIHKNRMGWISCMFKLAEKP